MVTPPAVRVKSRVKREVEGDSGVAALLPELLAGLLAELLLALLPELLPGLVPAGAEAFAGVFWAEAGLAVWVWLGDPDWLDAAYPTPRPSARARVAATRRHRPALATGPGHDGPKLVRTGIGLATHPEQVVYRNVVGFHTLYKPSQSGFA